MASRNHRSLRRGTPEGQGHRQASRSSPDASRTNGVGGWALRSCTGTPRAVANRSICYRGHRQLGHCGRGGMPAVPNTHSCPSWSCAHSAQGFPQPASPCPNRCTHSFCIFKRNFFWGEAGGIVGCKRWSGGLLAQSDSKPEVHSFSLIDV